MLRYFIIIQILLICMTSAAAADNKIIIFHGEQDKPLSLSAVMMAALENPDFLELPLVLSRDNTPVVYNDIFLNPQTNVADVFPARKRQDGNYYVADFLWSEIKQLSFAREIGGQTFTGHLTTFDEAIRMVKVLTKSRNLDLQVLPVIKFPWFYNNEGKDISSVILESSIANSVTADTVLYLKCYDPDELQRIHKSLLQGLPIEVKLILGIDQKDGRETMRLKRGSWVSYNYDWIFTRLGVRALSAYSNGLSFMTQDITDEEALARLIEDSHGLNMKVFVNMDTSLPPDALEMQFENVLFAKNFDGISLATPARLYSFLKERLPSEGGTSEDVNKTTKQPPASTILSDPEALSRRLKQLE